MSTKVPEQCEGCGAMVEPTDKAMPVEYKAITFPVKFWRYVCGCGRVWANALQRLHNQDAYRKGRKAAEWQQIGQ